MFEIKKSDLAGRIGILHSNHGKIETPAYVPVIHPVKQIIPTKKIKEGKEEFFIYQPKYINNKNKKIGKKSNKNNLFDKLSELRFQ